MVDLEEWSRQQQALAGRVRQEDAADWGLADPTRCALRLVAGLDISFFPAGGGAEAAGGCSGAAAQEAGAGDSSPAEEMSGEGAVAALVVLSFPHLEPVYEDLIEVRLAVPYRAGFLGFREVPAYLKLLERARRRGVEPQVLLVDGFGVLHPRGLGSASHLGVLAGLPTIGVAKNLLHVGGLDQKEVRAEVRTAQQAQREAAPAGSTAAEPAAPGRAAQPAVDGGAAAAAAAPAKEPSPPTGAAPVAPLAQPAPLLLRGAGGQVLGAAVCAAGCARPVYVSVGHLVSLQTAVDITLRCCKHRVPEPIRQADLRSRERVRQLVAGRRPAAAAAAPATAGATAVVAAAAAAAAVR